MLQKVLSIIILLCLCLALYSYAFADGELEFQTAFKTVIGGINKFGTTISNTFETVVGFFKNLLGALGSIGEKLTKLDSCS